MAELRSGKSLTCYHRGSDFDDPLVLVQAVVEERFGLDLQCFSECLPPFLGGAIGFVSYDAIGYYESIAGLQRHSTEPEIYFALVDKLIVVDNAEDVLHIVEWPSVDGAEKEEFAWLTEVRSLLEAGAQREQERPGSSQASPKPVHSVFSKSRFIEVVERAKEYIIAGDIFQVVLAHTLECDGKFDPFISYFKLKHSNPSPYHYLLRFPEAGGDCATLIGSSPEVMLQSAPTERGAETRVFMRPVAGTYPRVSDSKLDREQADALRADEKERAEHLMLVDLERNDIGRVAEIGSVKVSDLFSVETYRDVHHLVSEVSGVLPQGCHPFAALRSCFPIGTLAGTPKIRAMEIIAELEGPGRGIFGGAVVMLGADGMLDSCVAIRNAIIRSDSAVVRAGAGIVHDSVSEREHRECHWKAQAVLSSLGIELDAI